MTRNPILVSIVLLTALLLLMAVSVSADTLIWGGTYRHGSYFIDPVTGDTSPSPAGGGVFGASSSPYSGWVFVASGFNLWKVPATAQGNRVALGPLDVIDLAFDASTATLYGIGPGYDLYTVDYSCPDYFCRLTPLGVGFPGLVQGIDFVAGRGLYGAEINGTLWLLDPKTLQFSLIGNTGVFGIADLAYDSGTGRLIAASVGIKSLCRRQCLPETGMIWSIDPLTAQSVLLNGNAPPIYGLAEITADPSTILLFGTGVAGILVKMRRRLLCSPSLV